MRHDCYILVTLVKTNTDNCLKKKIITGLTNCNDYKVQAGNRKMAE